jgi:hypothetical protein
VPLENLLLMAFSGVKFGGISSEFLVEKTQRRNFDKAVKNFEVLQRELLYLVLSADIELRA